VAARRRDYGSYLFVCIDLLLAFAGQLILSVPLVLLVLLLFVATGHPLIVAGKESPEFAAWLTAPLFTLCGLFVTDGAMVLVVWYRLSRQRLDWSAVGLGADFLRPAEGRIGPGRAVLTGLGLGIVALVLSSIVGSIMQQLHVDQSGQDRLLIEPLRHAPSWIVVAMVFTGTFVAPAVEELFFRGYVFRAIAVRKGIPIAYIFSAGVFAAFHMMPNLFPALFVVGLVLCFAYQRTGNLLTDMTAHALNNGVAFAVALLPLH
jgi:membrane protease YdiL (CAAX protease family)